MKAVYPNEIGSLFANSWETTNIPCAIEIKRHRTDLVRSMKLLITWAKVEISSCGWRYGNFWNLHDNLSNLNSENRIICCRFYRKIRISGKITSPAQPFVSLNLLLHLRILKSSSCGFAIFSLLLSFWIISSQF